MRITSLAFAVVATACSVGVVQAAERSKPQVYVCERPTPAKYVTHQEHGRMTFVSAEKLLTERSAPAKPRCITQAELTRYRTLASQRTRTIASN